MQRTKLFPAIIWALAILGTVACLMATRAVGQTINVLYSFANNGTDGFNPVAGLVSDAAGNLYGTTNFGGTAGEGTVFELSPQTGGGWTEKILHSFANNGKDGTRPYSGLIFDAKGNLYGTTSSGGAFGRGTVFEMSPKVGGGWSEKAIYSFRRLVDGYGPIGGLVFDASGNLYGTTMNGGANGPCNGAQTCGIVFELSPTKTGAPWKEKILLNFDHTDGQYPEASLTFDSAGNLYGTTNAGGTSSGGVVFELTPSAGGTWTETVLYNFGATATDAAFPNSSNVVFDSAGNLYGTTAGGGTSHVGTVFELSPSSGGSWTEKILHDFIYNHGADGKGPLAGVILDGSGNLYGTTPAGGSGACGVVGCGIIFKLTPSSGGAWTESVYSFSFTFPHAQQGPAGGLIFGPSGNLYGTTYNEGANGDGTVFEFVP